jgi:YggT family protein
MNRALIFLLETFLGLFSLALLMRFYLQAVRAPARNPLSRFLNALTDFIVVRTRRVVPGFWGYDLSTLLLAWLTELLLVVLVHGLLGFRMGPAVGAAVLGMMALAALNLLRAFVYVLMLSVLAQAILSWVRTYSPAMSLLASLTRPFLMPLQKRVPLVGGVDLSPLLLLVVCQVVLMWPVQSLDEALKMVLAQALVRLP